MHPAAAWSVLVVASLGVFLGGVELMVVAIALPAIVADFGGWASLARASWIVNAYLLAYIVAMPLAGRAADLWGARRLYVVALGAVLRGQPGSRAEPRGRSRHRARLADRVAGGAGLRRRRHGAAVDGAGQPPVRGALARRRPGRRGSRDLSRHGDRPGLRGLGAAQLQPAAAGRRPGLVAMDLLPERAGRDHHPAADLRRGRRGGDAAQPRPHRPVRCAADQRRAPVRDRRPVPGRRARLDRSADPGRLRRRGGEPAGLRVRGAADAEPIDRPAAVRQPQLLRLERGEPADRVHAGDRHHRRPGVREPGAERRRRSIGPGADRPDRGHRGGSRGGRAPVRHGRRAADHRAGRGAHRGGALPGGNRLGDRDRCGSAGAGPRDLRRRVWADRVAKGDRRGRGGRRIGLWRGQRDAADHPDAWA